MTFRPHKVTVSHHTVTFTDDSIIIIIIIINGHFYSAANYPCMGSLAALYSGINTYNMALMIISTM